MNKNIHNCIRSFKEKGFDAILISNPVNVTYLTGFRNAEGYLLITSKREVCYFTSFLYKETAEKESYWQVEISQGNIFELVRKKVKQLGLKKIAFEAKNLPFLEYKKLKGDLLRDSVKFLETTDLVENLRAIKTAYEISLIKQSLKISHEAFEFVQEIHNSSMTEKDLSIELERFLRTKGDNSVAFPPIVASGRNSSRPHHISANTKLNKNLFLIDLGSRHYGYCADLTRVFFWGKIPTLLKRIYSIVQKAQEISIKKIKPGVKAGDIDKAARDFIDKKGFGKYFGHGLGHGVGLEVHEPPYLAPNNEQILKQGMVVTIEPAIYLKGKFGVRIEDMVLVKQKKGEIIHGHVHR